MVSKRSLRRARGVGAHASPAARHATLPAPWSLTRGGRVGTFGPRMARPHLVTIGGGTGHYTLLNGLRSLDARITAIVTMMDSGGSSGRLRDEYGLLPPGDFTRCLVALSSHPDAVKELLGHRFRSGSLEGHTVRNLMFTALQELTGSVPLTIERLHEIFAVENRVLPVTLDRVDLVVHLENDRIFRGEASIDGLADTLEAPVLAVYLEPDAEAYPAALAALAGADLIVIGPGDLYTSLVPNLLARGVREAIAASRARVVYVCNVMTKPNETPGYHVEDFVGTMAMYLGEARLGIARSHRPPRCPQEHEREDAVRAAGVERGGRGDRLAQELDHLAERVLRGRRALARLLSQRDGEPIVTGRVRGGAPLAPLSELHLLLRQPRAHSGVLLALDAERHRTHGAEERIGAALVRRRGVEVEGLRRLGLARIGASRPGCVRRAHELDRAPPARGPRCDRRQGRRLAQRRGTCGEGRHARERGPHHLAASS